MTRPWYGRLAGALALVLLLGGCALWDRIVDDPVRAALITAETQWSKAREVMYARDAAAIATCQRTEAATTCAAVRCVDPVCVAFRTVYDPRVRQQYNQALAAYSLARDSPSTAHTVSILLQVVLRSSTQLGLLDPSNAPLFNGINAAVAQAVAELQLLPTPAPAPASGALSPTGGISHG